MKLNQARRYVPVLFVLALSVVAAMATGQTTAPDRWLHVRVVNTNAGGETVRVNVPLSLAEKVLPAIKAHRLEHGRLKLSEINAHDVDIRAVLEAVRDTRDGEFVTVQGARHDVRVAKQGGFLRVEVRERREGVETNQVDVRLPFTVVEALLSGGKDELDIAAAVRALAAQGDTELVSVKDKSNTVRVWVDSKNLAE